MVCNMATQLHRGIMSAGKMGLNKSCRQQQQLFAGGRRARTLVVRAGKGKKEESVYSKTVNLPSTKFDMRANAKNKEPLLQKFWEEKGIYQNLYQESDGEPFTLHDGPPYANGDLHIGHALNKILKDFINRYQMLQGRKVKYVPGWDCHGLPIELKVLQSMNDEQRKALTPIKLRQKAAKFAEKTVSAQRDQFKRYGIWGDWDTPYMTLQSEYEAAQIGVFGDMYLKGHIYRGKKPVHWSPSSRTALAEAELEYPPGHTSKSVYVAFPVQDMPDSVPEEIRSKASESALAIWTTTPWTLPANAAVAVNARLVYTLCEVVPAEGEEAEDKPRYLVVAKDLVESVQETLGCGLTPLADLTGEQLQGSTYKHPLNSRISPVVVGGEYITTESGTGMVHTAPGHGQEDYQTGLKHNLPMLSPVDDDGLFTEEAGEGLEGLSVLGEGNTTVIEQVKAAGYLLLESPYAHKYPYDWRTKEPTIFRATAQWFASVEGFRDQALGAIKEVEWIPAVGENRITAMTEGRSDWCISRQRTWGVPIPVFYNTKSGEPLMNEETIKHIQDIVFKKGTDAWFYMDIEDLLPDKYKELAPTLRKGMDTMDVWFDSGSSWASVVDAREGLQLPANLYLEGSDQHRGWFQSSLLTSVASRDQAPFKTVLTHGFVLDERGYKMSKSLGNVVNPLLVIDGGKDQKKEPPYGADVLRLWVASVDYTNDVLIGEKIIKQMFDVYRKVRGTVRYLLGNLSDFDPTTQAVPYEDLPTVDKYALSKLADLVAESQTAYESYQFQRVFQGLNAFNTTFLSSFYLDMAKDRLYIRAKDDFARRSCQTVLNMTLQCLMSMIAPILPHMAEDAFQASHEASKAGKESVFQRGWVGSQAQWKDIDSQDKKLWDSVLQVREKVNKTLEEARAEKAFGAGLEAKVWLYTQDADLAARLTEMTKPSEKSVDELRYVMLVSQVVVTSSASDLKEACGKFVSEEKSEAGPDIIVGLSVADGVKCERCWNYSERVGESDEHPTLCERCAPVVISLPTTASVSA